ncbi:MAG: glycosyltransferase family 2 protein [Terriglobia bacterium]
MKKSSPKYLSQTSIAETPQSIILSVVIPALNEQDGIEEILQRILATKEALSSVGITGLEVLVVDDGSTDRTPEVVESIPGVRLVRHQRNRGYGAAIKTGFTRATGDLLAFLDADCTYPPECIVTLCETAIQRNADIVVGSRRSGAESRMPPVRRLGNCIWSSLLSVLGDAKVEDPASGMRVLWRQSLQRLYPLPDGLNFTPVMSTRALHEGLRVVEVPIPYHERAGRSKLSVMRDGMRFLRTILWTVFQYNPARIMELVGFGSLTAAGIIGAILIIARLQGVTELHAGGVFAVYSSLILAVAGVSIFALGISFNYLVALFYRQPIRQVNFLGKILGSSPERHFGWTGLVLGTAGITLAGASLILGLNGWQPVRIWFWLLGSALFLLVGIQLALFWILIRVLDALIERDDRIGEDLNGAEAMVSKVATGSRALASGSGVG